MPIRSWLRSLLRRSTFLGRTSKSRHRGSRRRSFVLPAVIESLEQRQLLTVAPVAAEIVVKAGTTDHPETPQVASDAAGDYVVVWFDGVGAIFGQRYSASGDTQGGAFQISQTGTATDNESIAMNSTGAFVVTWNTVTSDQHHSIFARQYNPTGVAVGDQFQVNATTVGDQLRPTVAIDLTGDFVIAWQNDGTSTGVSRSGTDIFAQRFSPTGATVGSEISVNPNQIGEGSAARVAMDSAGNFVVVWQSAYPGPNTSTTDSELTGLPQNGGEVDGQRFAKDGTAAGSQFRIDTANTGVAEQPAIAMDASGSFVVTWADYLGSGPPDISNDYKVFAQRYDATGAAQGSNIRVDQQTDHGNAPAIAMDNSGNFVITWTDRSGPVFGQRFDANGVTHDTPFQIAPGSTTATPVSPEESAVAMTTADHFIVAWHTLTVSASPAVDTITSRQFAFTATTAPVLSIPGTETPLSYTENDPETDVLGNFDINETGLSGTTLTGAVIQITGNYHIGQDRLAFWNTAPVQWSWDPAVGTLTLYGTASVADYETMLHSVTYLNVHDNPNTQKRTISITVTDGTRISNAVTRDITVTAVNDPPKIADYPVTGTPPTPPTYTPDEPIPLAVLLITDPEDSTMPSATIKFTANFVAGSDELDFTDTSTIKGSWDATNGVLTLTGNDTLENYTAAIHSITYHNHATNPTSLTKTLSVQGTDGKDQSNLFSTTVQFSTVKLSGVETTALPYTENAPATTVSPGITVTDTSAANITGATIQITGHYQAGQDRLSFTNTGGVQWSWNDTTGTLTLTGSAPLASYQQMLQSVAYQNVSDNPNTQTRTVTFRITDATGGSTATRDIAVTAVNDPPVISGISADPLAYTAKSPATAIAPSATVTDADNDQLNGATISFSSGYVQGQDLLSFNNTSKITATFDATTGTLTLTGTDSVSNYRAALQSILYKNDADLAAATTRTLTIKVTDGSATSTAATLTINLAPAAP